MTSIPDRELALVRLHRRALVAVPLLMAVALVTTVVIDYRNVLSVLATVERGQGEVLLRAARRGLRSGPPWSATADELLAENEAAGLVCVALFEPRVQAVLAVAGDCGLDPAMATEAQHAELGSRLRDTPPGLPIAIGKRLRMSAQRMPGGRGDDHRPDERGPDQPGPGDERGSDEWRRPAGRREIRRRLLDARRGGPEPPPILIEYEPRQTAALERGARRTLAVGGAVSAVLVLAALGLLQVARRAERDREQRERERRLASLGEMSAVLAHELRNPLASMKGNAQLLTERLAAGSGDHAKAARVVSEIERLESLTNDLLDFVRAPHLERSRVAPAALLRDAAESVGGGAELDVARGPAHWTLDGGRMRQVLVNLIANAVQASPAGQPPTASVEVWEGELVFTVRDHGAGIAAADRQRIFEPFHTTRVRGTGLGLAIAERIVKLHGGSIRAENHPAGGAVFRVTIPAHVRAG